MKYGIFETDKDGKLNAIDVVTASKKEVESMVKEYVNQNKCGYVVIMRVY